MATTYLYNLPNQSTGLDQILVDTLNSSPDMFNIAPLLLIFVYFTVLLGGISRQKARSGTADVPMWNVLAFFSIFIVELIMTMVSGFTNITTLAIVIMLTILSVVWLWLDKSRGES